MVAGAVPDGHITAHPGLPKAQWANGLGHQAPLAASHHRRPGWVKFSLSVKWPQAPLGCGPGLARHGRNRPADLAKTRYPSDKLTPPSRRAPVSKIGRSQALGEGDRRSTSGYLRLVGVNLG